MNELKMISETGSAIAGRPDFVLPTGYRYCDDLHERYAALLKSGRRRLAIGIRDILHHCPGHYGGCPKSLECAWRTTSDEPAEERSLSAARELISKSSFFIGQNRIFCGKGEALETKDDHGNFALNRELDLDILHRYEAPHVLEFLAMWEAHKRPNFGDFDLHRMEQLGIMGWLHVLRHDQDGGAYFQQFAQNMIEYSGRDGTGKSVLQQEAPAQSDMMLQLIRRLKRQARPSYSLVFRKRNLTGARKDAAMRRLDLPLFEGRNLVGSAVLIIPETTEIAFEDRWRHGS